MIGRCVALLNSSWDRHQSRSRSSCLARLTILHRHTTHNKCYSSFKDFSIAMLRFLRDDVPAGMADDSDVPGCLDRFPGRNKLKAGSRLLQRRLSRNPRTLPRRVRLGGKAGAARPPRSAGRTTGGAVACFIEGSGAGRKETARLALEADGTVSVYVGSTAVGQGLETVMAQIAADTLGLPLGQVRVLHGSTVSQGLRRVRVTLDSARRFGCSQRAAPCRKKAAGGSNASRRCSLVRPGSRPG